MKNDEFETGYDSLTESEIRKIENLVTKSDSYHRIISLKPSNESEFRSINGIGDKSIEALMPLINRIEKNNKEYLKNNFNSKIEKKLKFFEDKLTNVSQSNNLIWNSGERKNRLLDLSKLTTESQKNVYKLFDDVDTSKEFKLEIEEEYLIDSIRGFEELDEFEKDEKISIKQRMWFNTLYRENESQKIERGRNILYISPATLYGKINTGGQDLKVRTPLFLFPVEIRMSADRTYWIIKHDFSREIILNSFVSQFITENAEYDYKEDLSLEDNLFLFCEEFIINNKYSEKIEPFKTIKSNQKWNFLLDTFEIKNNFLLGLFQGFGDPIQAEIKSMIKNKYSTKMLNRFLLEGDINTRSEINEANLNVENDYNNDINLSYTNTLNAQQLKALKLINQDFIKGVTIWGPPGTGKSETIISIIENAVANGASKILLVSEKQAALEVVKERLGGLEDHSVLISDTKDKDGFYRQVESALENNIKYAKYEENSDSEFTSKFDELDDIYIQDENSNLILDIFRDKIFTTNFKISNKTRYQEILNLISELDINTHNILDLLKSIDKLKNLDYKEIGKSYLIISRNEEKSYDEILEGYILNLEKNENSICLVNENLEKKEEITSKVIETSGLKNYFKRHNYKKILKNKYGFINEDISKIYSGKYFEELEKEHSQLMQKSKELEKSISIIKPLKRTFNKLIEFNINIVASLTLLSEKNYSEDINMLKRAIIDTLFDDEEFMIMNERISNYSDYIEKIKFLSEQKAKNSRALIYEKIEERVEITSENNRVSNIRKLIDRKRKIPIRKFVNDYMVELKNLIPIWLMQPEAVPTLFDISEQFDVVIFDEASQMFLERSIPAILRAKKIVVLGDEKQLGPSNFFAGRISSEDEDDMLVEQNESLLTYAKSKLVQVMLKNHYRSQSIGLIKFSNEKYYENQLNFIDLAKANEKRPIEYHFVEDGKYFDNVNEPEVNKIVEVIKGLKKSNPNDSIAIITTNQKQRELVHDKLYFEYPDLYSWLQTHKFIIKAIENVQGDERDIIIFSTTFGPDQDGVQKMNFGPISNALGSNRINVAVTRAKKKMVVVSSIDLEQASKKVNSLKNQGPKDFIDYIKFAKNYDESKLKSKINVSDVAVFESVFEEEVYEKIMPFIKERKLKILTQYETLGYRIDMVIIDSKNNIITALECDGATFHSSFKSRERDYQRQEFLEARGWNVYRIWSTDWWNGRDYETKQFIKFIDQIIKEGNYE